MIILDCIGCNTTYLMDESKDIKALPVCTKCGMQLLAKATK